MSKPFTPILSIEVVKAIAIILVVNSHLDWLWGNSLMASGGSLGNSLFFIASGVGLEIGWRKHPSLPFRQWYIRRLKRIYPSVIIASLAGIALGLSNFFPPSLPGLFNILVYPTNFWFISAILLFYVPGYLVLRGEQRLFMPSFVICALIVYFCWYSQLDLSLFAIEGSSYFRWVFYFLVFLSGIAMAKANILENGDLRQSLHCISGGGDKRGFNVSAQVVFLFLAAGLYLSSKILFSGVYDWLMPFQFVAQLTTLCMAVSLFWVSVPVSSILLQSQHVRSLVMLLSSLTLEIYLVDSLVNLSPVPVYARAILVSSESPAARGLVAIFFCIALIASARLVAIGSAQMLSIKWRSTSRG